ncbi:AMP-binding enzyme family protein (macronuclear) [Tetrahymena thermophila SB210]|uniref:AMP-binding enzyme family protein n=1 Tax=Tetrahymena thermophila (strain SB210) TaxID=312017 RepID=Q231L1_TETTS|nr:AMP-binding enzyme family protein [Tetrahymena thermophila SB210]EAR91291.2 AMP-binding enzyme family protein [Tetrahymena thermophila SB210]|eukprot:XP_001011536.2 AMP-binding enzyme family protein [Tetrahymena thermophila SB210]
MDLQEIDLFSSQFSFTVGKSSNHTKKGTKQGVFLSLIVFFFAIGYFSYLLYQFVNNQIDPNYKSQNFITEEEIDINLSSDLIGFRFEYDTNQDIENLQAQQNQTYLVFYAYFYNINGTSLTQTQLNIIQCTNPQLAGFYCLDFSPVQNNTLTLSTKDNFQSQIFIYTYGCLDLDFNKNSTPSNCANQTDINNIVNGQNAGFRLKMFTSQFNTQTKQIQVNYRNYFTYAIGNSISYTTLKAQKQVTSVKEGFFIQSSSNYSSPIAYETSNQLWDREYFISQINQSGYGMIELIMDEIVQQVQIQYPTIPQMLALVNSTLSLLMILGFIGRRFSWSKIKNDLFLMLLQNFYQQKYMQILESNQLLEQKDDVFIQSNQYQQSDDISNKSKFQNDQSDIFQNQLEENQNRQIIFPNLEFKSKQVLDQIKSQNGHNYENKEQLNTGQLLTNRQMEEQCQEQITLQNTSLEKKIIKELDQNNQNLSYKIKSSFIQEQFAQAQSNYKLIKPQTEEIQVKNQIYSSFSGKKANGLKNISLNQNDKQLKNLSQLKASLSSKVSEKISSILFKLKFFNKKEYDSSKGLDKLQKRAIEKQLSKDLNIFEFYKDIIFLKKAVMILFTSEQLATLRIIGCSSNFLDESKHQQTIMDTIKNKSNYFQEQYKILQSENLQFEKIAQFIQKSKKNEPLTEIDKRLLSSICI